MITVVGLGPGDPDGVPATALDAVARAEVVRGYRVPPALAAMLPVRPATVEGPEGLPDPCVVVAPDAEAHRLAQALPGAETLPPREVLRRRAIGAEVANLAAVGLRLRRECPWDREQDAASIVPHTIEEAFEVADAVASGDPARQADELGDLLFQAVFLSGLLEEERAGDLGSVARGQADKLISRHPHVYGEAVAESAGRVVDLWERRKREERADEGVFHELPAGLPALAYATKVQKRAGAIGFEFRTVEAALLALAEEAGELAEAPSADELGDVLFAAVAVGRAMGADPELALRAAAQRFRDRVERAIALARAAGVRFEGLPPDEQLAWYERAR